MSKGNYTHIKYLEAEILSMKESGKTKREIAEHYGLKTEQVKGNLYSRPTESKSVSSTPTEKSG